MALERFDEAREQFARAAELAANGAERTALLRHVARCEAAAQRGRSAP